MGDHLLTHNSRLLLFSTFLNTIPVGYLNVVPLVYLAEIGYDPATIGLIYSVSAVALTVGLIPFGFLADRYGKKKLLIAGTFLPCVAYAIFGLTLDPLSLIIASIVGGIGFAGGLSGAIEPDTHSDARQLGLRQQEVYGLRSVAECLGCRSNIRRRLEFSPKPFQLQLRSG